MDTNKFLLSVVIEKDSDGYYAYCPALQGCFKEVFGIALRKLIYWGRNSDRLIEVCYVLGERRMSKGHAPRTPLHYEKIQEQFLLSLLAKYSSIVYIFLWVVPFI